LNNALSKCIDLIYFLFYFKLFILFEGISIAFAVCSATSVLFVISGTLGFFGCQTYLCRLFHSFGTLVTGENSQLSTSEALSGAGGGLL
jgi:hypothetical protein